VPPRFDCASNRDFRTRFAFMTMNLLAERADVGAGPGRSGE
jgi:hypothetical protein